MKRKRLDQIRGWANDPASKDEPGYDYVREIIEWLDGIRAMTANDDKEKIAQLIDGNVEAGAQIGKAVADVATFVTGIRAVNDLAETEK